MHSRLSSLYFSTIQIGDLSWTDYTVSAHAKLLQSTISDEDSGASNPAPLQLLPCTPLPSISEQVWVESAPPSGVGQFRSNVSGLCLSQNGAGHGQRSPVTLQKCTGPPFTQVACSA